jgi:hypothetical protein
MGSQVKEALEVSWLDDASVVCATPNKVMLVSHRYVPEKGQVSKPSPLTSITQ